MLVKFLFINLDHTFTRNAPFFQTVFVVVFSRISPATPVKPKCTITRPATRRRCLWWRCRAAPTAWTRPTTMRTSRRRSSRHRRCCRRRRPASSDRPQRNRNRCSSVTMPLCCTTRRCRYEIWGLFSFGFVLSSNILKQSVRLGLVCTLSLEIIIFVGIDKWLLVTWLINLICINVYKFV